MRCVLSSLLVLGTALAHFNRSTIAPCPLSGLDKCCVPGVRRPASPEPQHIIKGTARNAGTSRVVPRSPRRRQFTPQPAPLVWSSARRLESWTRVLTLTPFSTFSTLSTCRATRARPNTGEASCNGTMTTGVRQPLLSDTHSTAAAPLARPETLSDWIASPSVLPDSPGGSWVRSGQTQSVRTCRFRAGIHQRSLPFVQRSCTP